MRKYSYVHCDVFTDRPFGGTPLIVFPEAEGMSYDDMQSLAGELNHSETTFVFESTSPDAQRKVRIFTPHKEIPFGGHSVLGTAMVLAVDQGLYDETGTSLRLQLRNGIVQVDFADTDEGAYTASLILDRPEAGAVIRDRERLCQALGLEDDDIDDIAPPQVISAGLPWLFTSVMYSRSLTAIQPNPHLLASVTNECGAVGVYVFSLESPQEEFEVACRAFCPSLGILEVPANGSAAGALGGYLIEHRYLGDGRHASLRISQGKEMGRPSKIQLEAFRDNGEVNRIRIGGSVSLIGRGDFVL